MLTATLENLAAHIVLFLGVAGGSRLYKALTFFIADVAKIFILLLMIIYIVTFVRSYFPPEKTRKYLSGRRILPASVLAAMLGILTPFWTCSAISMFIGFIEAGVPIGATFSFLVASPVINEVALGLLILLFGWKLAALYLFTGLTIAVISGYTLSKIKPERFIAGYVFEAKVGEVKTINKTLRLRHLEAWRNALKIIKKVGLYIVLGVGLGAAIHGYVPIDFIAQYAGKDNIFAVPFAVIVGVPMYANAAGTIPIIQALVGKGMPIGSALAFMMSVTALSLPEFVILKKVMRTRLLAVFASIVTLSIIGVGYLYNLIL